MPPIEIVHYPAEVLRRPCVEVDEISGSLVTFVEQMFDAMYEAPGVGLAAPQVGRSQRFFVMDPEPETREQAIALFNPVITERHGLRTSDEGCLSIPGFFAEVERAEEVCVRAVDIEGSPIELDLAGFPAVIAQHEIDHLDGVLFVDHLSKTRRRLFERDYGKDPYRWKFKKD